MLNVAMLSSYVKPVLAPNIPSLLYITCVFAPGLSMLPNMLPYTSDITLPAVMLPLTDNSVRVPVLVMLGCAHLLLY
jgi:hypothetical protein